MAPTAYLCCAACVIQGAELTSMLSPCGTGYQPVLVIGANARAGSPCHILLAHHPARAGSPVACNTSNVGMAAASLVAVTSRFGCCCTNDPGQRPVIGPNRDLRIVPACQLRMNVR